jgi:hypothetical protein
MQTDSNSLSGVPKRLYHAPDSLYHSLHLNPILNYFSDNITQTAIQTNGYVDQAAVVAAPDFPKKR